MVEFYKINHRIGRSVSTGGFEWMKIGETRKIHKFVEIYKTDIGEMPPEQWREKLSNAIVADKETDVLEIIKEHCREHCAWLHSEDEITEYAMDILASRVFLCGNECWKDVADKVRDKYIIFDFTEVVV